MSGEQTAGAVKPAKGWGVYREMLARYVFPQRRLLWSLAALLLVSIGLQLVNPQIIRYFIDSAQGQGSITALYYAAGLFIAFSLLQQGVSVAAAYFSENLGWTTTNKLRAELAEHCLSLDMSFHKTQTSGSLIERVDGDVNALANFFSSFIIHLAGNVVLMLGILALLFRENFWIGLVMTAFVIGAVYVIQWIRKFNVPVWKNWRQINAEFYGFIGEHLEGTEDTRANGAAGYVMNRFYEMTRRMLPIRMRAFLGFCMMWSTTILVFALGNAAAFIVCAILWKNGQSGLTIGSIYLVFYYTEQLAKPIEKIRTQLEDLQKADASLMRVRDLLATKPLIQDGPGAPLPEGPLAVEFRDLEFAYEEGGRATLDHLQLRLEPGQTLGLLGRTGSGKTTIARLLLRFYDPQSGAIELAGTDIRQCKLHELRRKVAMVTQNIEILEGSVRDNLTLFDDGIRDGRIAEVLHDLGLGAWYEALPDGLDTMLASGGGSLSAGEAQLLAFARVFLTNPGLVILDEASSRLDPLTEARIEAAVDRLLEEKTCIIIAHRLATIQRADRILILENGRMLESGRREELAADPKSRFSRMLAVGMEEVLA
ncbi:ATP-binding cassette, subfamily B [Paenibacillus sp. RU4T]|uniref:ABC transporter ATP-binding protein n=1 Tax=Paenibacillus sp. RU4T TaxID=1907394 RepID=UPI000955902F|nr:ABC transporter ATP-binding protein [Paenibacillus sp. RUD330]SIQ78895.1 ATP-binding cassette, subfamily B [Paenibacillus sp. RU4X]SIR00315.1 ATP-binding cassette, subfamily B [Paenibacillus sp. RU4T]